MKTARRQLVISLYHLSPMDAQYGCRNFVGLEFEEDDHSITFYGVDELSELDLLSVGGSLAKAFNMAKQTNFDSVSFDQRAGRISELPYYKSHWLQRWSEYGRTMSDRIRNQIDIIQNARK